MKLYVQDWLARKNCNRKYYDVEVFGIIGETEKAVKVFMASDTCGKATYWCPKSCLIAANDYDPLGKVTPEFTTEELKTAIDTHRFESYEEAYKAYEDGMFGYR